MATYESPENPEVRGSQTGANLHLPISGVTVIRIADPVVEVRDSAGGLLGVFPWRRRDVGSLLAGWSGRTGEGVAWSIAVGYAFPTDGLAVRFQRRRAGTSFLTPVTGWVQFLDHSDLGAPWAAEVVGDFTAVSFVSGVVREAYPLHRQLNERPPDDRAA